MTPCKVSRGFQSIRSIEIASIIEIRRLILGSVLACMLAACSTTDTPEQRLEAAQQYLASNNLNAAIIEIKNALQMQPDMAEARWMLGSLYLQLGAGEAAERELQNARQLGDTRVELTDALLQAYLLQRKFDEVISATETVGAALLPASMLHRGDALIGLQRKDEAAVVFNQVLQQQADSVDARLGLTRLALLQGSFAEAERLLAEAEALAPEQPTIFILKGELGMRSNNASAAEAAYARATDLAERSMMALAGLIRALLAQEKIDAANTAIARLEKLSAQNPLPRYFRGVIALRDNNETLAASHLLEVLKVLPDHAESQLLMAQITYKQGKLEQTLDYLRAFLAQVPEHTEALQLLATVQIRLNQTNDAIANINKVIAIKGEDPGLLALLASASFASGQVTMGVEILERAVEMAPDNAVISTQLASAFLNQGSVDQAVAILEKTIAGTPDYLPARELLVTTYLRNENFDAAIRSAEELTTLQPDSAGAANLLGTAYLSAVKKEEANAQFERAIALDPLFVPGLYNLARMEIDRDNTEAAEAHYRKILTVQPDHVQTLLELARIESRKGEIDNMIGLVDQARKANPESITPRVILGRHYMATGDTEKLLEVATESAKVAPGNPDVQILLAQAQRLNGKPEEALKILDPLNSRLPDTAAILYELAQVHLQLGKYEATREYLDRVLKLIPNHPAALGTSIELAIRQNDQESARRFAGQLEKQQPESPQTYILIGDTYISEKNYTEAIAAYEKAIRIAPSFRLTAKLSQTHELAGDRNRAIALMQQWREKNPDDSGADLILAGIYMRAAENRLASEHYEKVLTVDSDNFVALNNLSWLYLDTNLTRARELAERANRIQPNDAGVMDTLGWVLAKQGQNEQAIPLLRKALQASPGSADIRYHLAFALAAAGDEASARNELAVILGSNEDFMEKQAALELSKRLQ